MFFQDDDDTYEPSNISQDLFISEMPLSVIIQSIREQFAEPFINDNDYMSIFIDAYVSSIANCHEDNIDILKSMKDSFISEVRLLLLENYNIGFADFDQLGDDEQNEVVKVVYRFFTVNGIRGAIHCITNYIILYKDKLSVAPDIVMNDDVTTLSIKKEISDNDIVIIISNLSSIINFILSQDIISVEDYLELSSPDKFIETRLMNSYYDKLMITGNFVYNIFNNIDSEIFIRVKNKVRTKLIRKFKN